MLIRTYASNERPALTRTGYITRTVLQGTVRTIRDFLWTFDSIMGHERRINMPWGKHTCSFLLSMLTSSHSKGFSSPSKHYRSRHPIIGYGSNYRVYSDGSRKPVRTFEPVKMPPVSGITFQYMVKLNSRPRKLLPWKNIQPMSYYY